MRFFVAQIPKAYTKAKFEKGGSDVEPPFLVLHVLSPN